MNQMNSRANGFATASMVLGVCAILSAITMTIIPPMILGSLSIILGLLSRGDQKFPHNVALAGIITGACALIINIGIFVFSYQMIFQDPETTQLYWDTMNESYEQMLGISLDDLLKSYGLKE
jgi:hypothetical protein